MPAFFFPILQPFFKGQLISQNRASLRGVSMRWWVVVMLMCVCAGGCDSSAVRPLPPQRLPAISNTDAVDTDDLTVAEARQFAVQWQQAIANQDTAKVKQLVSWSTIVDNALAGLPMRVRRADRNGFAQGSATFLDNFAQLIGQEMDAGGEYQKLRVANRGKRLHVIFRLIGQSGLNYHDLRLVKQDGVVRIDSIFFATTGETVSTTLRNTAAPAFASRNLLGTLSGEAKKSLDEIKQQAQMVRAHTQGDNAEALRLYNAMPDRLKKTRTCMLIRISATDFETDEEAYLNAIEEYLAAFPGSPSIGILLADVGILKMDSDLLKQSRAQITKFCGGDPYFDLTVASGLCTIGDTRSGLELSHGIDPATIKNDDAHDLKMTIGLLTEDFDTVLEQLRILRDDYGYEFSDFSQVEDFKAFSQSPQHAQWLED